MNKRKIVALALSLGFVFSPVAQVLATENVPAGIEADGKEEQDLLKDYIDKAKKEEKDVSLLEIVKEIADPVLEARLLEVYGLKTDTFILNQSEKLNLDLKEPVSVDEFVKLLKDKNIYTETRLSKISKLLEEGWGNLTDREKESIKKEVDLKNIAETELKLLNTLDNIHFLSKIKSETVEKIKKDDLLSDKQKEGYINKITDARTVAEIESAYENVNVEDFVKINKSFLKEIVGNLDFEIEEKIDDLKNSKDVELFIESINNKIEELKNKDDDKNKKDDTSKEEVLPGYPTEYDAELDAIKALKDQKEYDSYEIVEDDGRYFYKLRKLDKKDEDSHKESNEDVKEKEVLKTDKTKLEDAISRADNILKDVSKGTVEQRDILFNKLAEARKVKDKEDATQEEINNSVDELEKAISEVYKKADKSELEKMIKAGDEVLSDVNKGTTEERQTLISLMEKARNVNTNDNASQEDVDKATKELRDLILKIDPENKIAAKNAKTGVIGLASVGVLLAAATGTYIYNNKKE